MMDQFWTYRLEDGRRVLVLAGADLSRWDLMVGFGRVVAVLP